jgi:glycosyltransferase involved in cell wall biosynthesis
MTNKPYMLVLTSTFPRWKCDSTPPFVFELTKRLNENFRVTVITPHCPGALEKEVLDGVEVVRFKYFIERFEKLCGHGGILPTLRKCPLYWLVVPFLFIFNFMAVLKVICRERPDIIHAHWIIPQGFVASIIKKIYKIPYLATAHGGDIFGLKGFFLKPFKLFVLKNASKISVVSSAIKNEILANLDSKLKIEVISMGVDSEYFSSAKRDISLKKEYQISSYFLLFVGRLAEKKGVRYLIEAMLAVTTVFPETKLLIVGTGTLDQELKTLTKQLHLENNIVFAGQISNLDLPRYYATADVFIGPSVIATSGDREGLPVTFMEAMSCGCVPIVTDLEGNTDLVQDNITGFLVRQKDSEAMAKKIIELLSNPSLMTNMKNESRKKIVSQFDWKTIADKYEAILTSALDKC